MMRNSKVALAAVSVLMIVLLGAFIYGLLYVRGENQETRELLKTASQTESQNALIQSVRVLRASANEEITNFENLALSDSNLVKVIEDIEDAGEELNLDLEITSVEKIGESSGTEPQKIRITTESDGTWAGSFLFLKALESLPHRVMFDSVNFEKKEGAWHSTITLILFSFK